METNPFLKRLSKGLNAICRNAKLIPKTILESNLTWPNYCKILLVGYIKARMDLVASTLWMIILANQWDSVSSIHSPAGLASRAVLESLA